MNASMYDAQQGATSGAQIDVNTSTGTNNWHGQLYGYLCEQYDECFAFFFNQALSTDPAGNRGLPAVDGQPLASSLEHGHHGGWSYYQETSFSFSRPTSSA